MPVSRTSPICDKRREPADPIGDYIALERRVPRRLGVIWVIEDHQTLRAV